MRKPPTNIARAAGRLVMTASMIVAPGIVLADGLKGLKGLHVLFCPFAPLYGLLVLVFQLIFLGLNTFNKRIWNIIGLAAGALGISLGARQVGYERFRGIGCHNESVLQTLDHIILGFGVLTVLVAGYKLFSRFWRSSVYRDSNSNDCDTYG